MEGVWRAAGSGARPWGMAVGLTGGREALLQPLLRPVTHPFPGLPLGDAFCQL